MTQAHRRLGPKSHASSRVPLTAVRTYARDTSRLTALSLKVVALPMSRELEMQMGSQRSTK